MSTHFLPNLGSSLDCVPAQGEAFIVDVHVGPVSLSYGWGLYRLVGPVCEFLFHLQDSFLLDKGDKPIVI